MDDETTQCLACRSDISARASVCTACGGYQDWRRFLSIGTNTLALLIALVSVSTVLVGTISDLATEYDERAVANLVGFDSDFDAVTLLVSNLGKKPAAIQDVMIETADGDRWNLSLDYDEPRIVESGRTIQLDLLSPRHLPKVSETSNEANLEIVVLVRRFDGGVREERIPLATRIAVETGREVDFPIISDVGFFSDEYGADDRWQPYAPEEWQRREKMWIGFYLLPREGGTIDAVVIGEGSADDSLTIHDLRMGRYPQRSVVALDMKPFEKVWLAVSLEGNELRKAVRLLKAGEPIAVDGKYGTAAASWPVLPDFIENGRLD